jgi:Cu(I)/Ag(I) efflux system membrane protein CusA/SilA
MLSVPFTVVGGVWLLNYNPSVAVRFISLAGRRPNVNGRYGAVLGGAVEGVRPKMMTVTAVMVGLLPIMWGTGTGSEVTSIIAAPMVGGMISSTVLTLAVIPAICALVEQWRLRRGIE